MNNLSEDKPVPQQWVYEATEADFQSKVLEQSVRTPVLLDLWAPWCAPCRTLTPILEKLAAEYQGAFHLVKLNIEENQNLATMLGVQSIPAVKLLRHGQLLGDFMGALPEAEVRQFLERHLGAAVSPGEQLQTVDEALLRWHQGERAQAELVFRETLEKEAANSAAHIGMGLQALHQGDLDAASASAEAAAKGDWDSLEASDRRRFIKSQLDLLQGMVLLSQGVQHPPAGKAEEKAAVQAYQKACQQALQGSFQDALEQLLQLMKSHADYGQQAPKKAVLAVFQLLPPDSELVKTYRRRLSSMLFQ